jgi:hypothetical protein
MSLSSCIGSWIPVTKQLYWQLDSCHWAAVLAAEFLSLSSCTGSWIPVLSSCTVCWIPVTDQLYWLPNLWEAALGVRLPISMLLDWL